MCLPVRRRWAPQGEQPACLPPRFGAFTARHPAERLGTYPRWFCAHTPIAPSQEEQRSLLKFVTSCSRAPLGGFKHLHPPLTIHKAIASVPCSCCKPSRLRRCAAIALWLSAAAHQLRRCFNASLHRASSVPTRLPLPQVDCGASLLAAVGGKDVDRLPTASTCSNTLKVRS